MQFFLFHNIRAKWFRIDFRVDSPNITYTWDNIKAPVGCMLAVSRPCRSGTNVFPFTKIELSVSSNVSSKKIVIKLYKSYWMIPWHVYKQILQIVVYRISITLLWLHNFVKLHENKVKQGGPRGNQILRRTNAESNGFISKPLRFAACKMIIQSADPCRLAH